jgi:hypothetical protein
MFKTLTKSLVFPVSTKYYSPRSSTPFADRLWLLSPIFADSLIAIADKIPYLTISY